MYCQELEALSSTLSWVELMVGSTSLLSCEQIIPYPVNVYSLKAHQLCLYYELFTLVMALFKRFVNISSVANVHR